jgi:NADPH:quinone reductase-like Zn-dependent oxidoreductase
MGAPTPGTLTAVAEQVAAGALHIEIERTFPLADAAAALAAFQAGTRGKIVVVI